MPRVSVITMSFALLFGMAEVGVSQVPPDSAQLEELVVTATRLPMARDRVVSTVTVLQGEELRRRGIVRVTDALRLVAGMAVAPSGSFGGQACVFVRGGESDYVKVLVDGVPMNQPGGWFDFGHLSTLNVERIEVLRGPASVLYGSDAMSGVVHIVTRRGDGNSRVAVELHGGSYGTRGGTVELVGGGANYEYTLAGAHASTAGIHDFNSDYASTVFSGRIDLRPDVDTDVALSYRYRDSQVHIPTDGAGNVVDRNQYNSDDASTVALRVGRRFGPWLESTVALASNEMTLGADDAQDDAADTLGFYAFQSLQTIRRQSVDWRLNAFVTPGVVLTAGLLAERQDETAFNESLSEFGPSNGSFEARRSTRAGYVQALVDLGPVSLTGGSRIDDNSAYGFFATYRFGAMYRMPSSTRVRASLGRSFKAPTFFETSARGFVTGNPDLEPERSFGWEIGVEQDLGSAVRLGATYFRQRFRDLIQFDFAQTPNYVNLAAADVHGVEIESAWRLTRTIDVSANVTHVKTTVVDAGVDTGAGATFVEGERLLRRPAWTGSVRATWRLFAGASLGASASYQGERVDRDFKVFPAAPVVLDAYALVGAHLRVPMPTALLGRFASLHIRADNLLDTAYQSVFGFRSPGRQVIGGIRIESP